MTPTRRDETTGPAETVETEVEVEVEVEVKAAADESRPTTAGTGADTAGEPGADTAGRPGGDAAGRLAGEVGTPGDRLPAERSEPSGAVDQLLMDPPDPTDESQRPGAPMQRSNPFVFGFFAALGVLVAWGIWNALGEARSALILLIVSMFLAVGLNPLVEWFIRRGLKRGLAVAVVFLLVVLVFAGVGFAIVPVVTEQVDNLIDNAPQWLDLLNKSRSIQELDQRYQFIDKAKDYVQDPAMAQRAFGGVLGVSKVVANLLFSTFTVLVLTLYLLASLPAIKRAAYSLVPASRRPRVTLLGDQVLGRVGGYVSGQLVVALIAGTSAFIFLEIVGLREYALALAIVLVFTAFIPMVGGLIGTVIITLIGLTAGLWIGVACLAYGVVYQQVENYIIAPRVMRRAVDIPGAVTVIAALLGGTLLGVVGALLAIPTAAAVMLIVREVWVRKADAS